VGSLLRTATGRAAGDGGLPGDGLTGTVITGQPGGVSTASHPGNGLNGHRAAGGTAADEDDEEFDEPHRRWPVVTSILVVLVLLVSGGLYVGYRAIQGNYYLAADGSQVSIYRGISQKIAFLSLSSVYQQTGIPVSHVPGDLTLPTNPTTLARTRATVTSIQRSYTCRQAASAVAAWTARYGAAAPTPTPTPTSTPGKGKKGSKKPKKPPAVTIPPKPSVPAYCPAQGSG